MATISLRPERASELVKRYIAAKIPVLLTGAPGVGKSSIVEQAAAASGFDVILSHPVVADPTDAKGLPWPGKDGTEATFLPFGDLAQAIKASRPTVWFLDDLGQASPAVQASFMQLLLARRVNGHVLPDCVTFVAATNRRTDRAGVSGILTPVLSRFGAVVGVEVAVDDWCRWAFGAGVPPELISFMRFRPKLLHDMGDGKKANDMENFPCPRTWEYAGKAINMALPDDLEFTALAGAVGGRVGTSVATHRRRDSPFGLGLKGFPFDFHGQALLVSRETTAPGGTGPVWSNRAYPQWKASGG